MDISINGKQKRNVTWTDIEECLSELKREAFFRLSQPFKPGPIQDNIEIQSQDGYYLPLAIIREKGGLLEFYDPSKSDEEEVTILGYDYDPTSVTQDFDLVVSMIREFYETGNVTSEFMK